MCFDPKIPQPGTPDMASEIVVKEAVLPAKARFCVKCKEYFPVACFVGKDGTADATLCNRHEPAKNGLRYCRGCDDYVALDLFPKKTRPGYACKKHFNMHGGGKRAYDKISNNPHKRNLKLQWKRFYNDSVKFKHPKTRMSKREVELEILKVDPSATGNYAVMPVDTRIATGPQNVVIVTLQQRKTLMKKVDMDDTAEYASMVSEILASYQ